LVNTKKGEVDMEVIAEGKTKVILDAGEGNVILESKDDITAGDGAKKDVIEGKGELATRTTANVFRLLNRHNIPTHFLEQIDETKLLCKRCEMIPLEVTIRGTATGSYLKRNPKVTEGAEMSPPVVEFFLKDDSRHDPLIVIDEKGKWILHQPKTPLSNETIVGSVEPSLLSSREVPVVKEQALQVFSVLKEAWAKFGILLVDLKIEFGRLTDNGLVVGDVIDNDSWRLWPAGKKEQQLDKQIYREGGNLETVLESYREVTGLTDRLAEI
jgi:phosphoribosylaminoimidazole-succinocarboxamide synthase